MSRPPVTQPSGPSSTGSSRRSLAVRGGLWSAAGQILPAAGTAVLSVAAGRYLGSGPLGQQSLIAYLNAASAAVVLVALRTSLLQLGGRLQGQGDTERLGVLVRWSVPAHLVGGVAVLGILLASGLLDGGSLTPWLVIGVVALFDAGAYGLSVRMILAEGWVGVGRLRLVSQLVAPVLGLVFLFTGFGITGIFLGDGVAAVGLLFFLRRRHRRFRPAGAQPRVALRPPVPVLRSVLLFAVSALITQVVSKRVEFIVLALFAGNVAIGMYSVAFMIVNLLGMIPLGIATAAMPTVAATEGSGETQAAARHLRMALRIGTTLTIPVVALLAVLGPSSILLVYGSAYATAAHLVPLASLSLLVSVVIGLCSQYWSGRGRLSIVLGTGAAAAVADLAVAFALIPALGPVGAVAANLVGQFTLAAGLLVATVRNLGGIGWRPGSVVRALLVAAAGVASALAVELVIDRLLDAGELRSAAILVIGTLAVLVVCPLAAVRLKLVNRDEAEWLAPLLPGRARGVLARVTAS